MKHTSTFVAITAFTILLAGCSDDNPPVTQQPVYQTPPQIVQQVQPQSEFDGSDALSAAAGAAAGYALANRNSNTGSGNNSNYNRPTVVHKTVIVNNTVVKKSPSYYSKPYSYKPSSSYKTTTIRTTKSYSRR